MNIITNEYGIYYYLNGKLHRDEDLPAGKWKDGSKFWYQNGKLHRDNDLPAIEYNNGTKFWFQNDQLHRLDGPAIEWNDGDKEWYYQGEKIQCLSTEEFVQLIKLRAFW